MIDKIEFTAKNLASNAGFFAVFNGEKMKIKVFLKGGEENGSI